MGRESVQQLQSEVGSSLQLRRQTISQDTAAGRSVCNNNSVSLDVLDTSLSWLEAGGDDHNV